MFPGILKMEFRRVEWTLADELQVCFADIAIYLFLGFSQTTDQFLIYLFQFLYKFGLLYIAHCRV